MANYARMVLLQIDPLNTLFPKVYITTQERTNEDGQISLMYILPGGKIEPGEDEIDTLIREQREEGQFPYDFWTLIYWNFYEFHVRWEHKRGSKNRPIFPNSPINYNVDIIRVYAELGELPANSSKDSDSITGEYIDLYSLTNETGNPPIFIPDNVLRELKEVWKVYWTDFVLEKPSEDFYIGKEPMYPWQELKL